MKQYEFIAIDFDGTLNKHAFPEIGPPNKRTIKFVKYHASQGTKIILHTCRENDKNGGRQYLTEAVEWCKKHEIPIDAVNENPFVSFGKRKIYADIYIDDRAINVNSIIINEMWLKTITKYIILAICGFLLFRAGQAAAFEQRGYIAYGGECFFLGLPIYYFLIASIIRDIAVEIKNIKENGGFTND